MVMGNQPRTIAPRRWNRFARPVGGSWRVDETYLKVRGRWVYLYRAVDARGKTIDFRLRPKRDVAAAKAFFRKAFTTQRPAPRTITLDGYQASHRAVRELCAERRKLRGIKVGRVLVSVSSWHARRDP